MRNARTRITGQAAEALARRAPIWALALVGALMACGKASSPGGPAAPSDPGTPSAGVALRSITVAPPSASAGKGVGVRFTATGHYSDGSSAVLPFASWSSSDDLVASVDSALGLVQCAKAGGPVTITARDPSTGLAGNALLTVTAPTLRSVELVPSVATVVIGYPRTFSLLGRYSDGSSASLSAAWSSSDDGTLLTVSAGTVVGKAAGGPVILTATDSQSGLAATATLTVEAPPPATEVSASSTGTIDASNISFDHVVGLTAGTEYLVRVSATAPLADPTALQVEVDRDATFTGFACSSWAGGPPCRAGVPGSAGDLFVAVTAPAGTSFALDVSPLPVLQAGAAAATGTVDTETYFRVDGLTALGTFELTLAGLTDVFADAFVYDAAQPPGAFGSGLLCSTVQASPLPTKTCTGAVPASGTVYVTVEGWLTGALSLPFAPTPPGTSFTLAAL